jgi:ferredoxin
MTTDNDQWLPRIDRARCVGSGHCITGCPTGALGWQDGKAALLYPDLCSYCGICEEVCPVGAIELPYLIVKRQSPDNGET